MSYSAVIIRYLYLLGIVYIFFMFLAYFFSDRMMFFPQKSSYEDNSEIIKIESEVGVEISAIYLPNPDAEFTILFSHGNAEDLGDISYLLKMIHSRGYSVFAYDYRGYGTSGGRPSAKNAVRDVNAAYEYMVENLNIPPENIIAHGRSLGGAVAVDLASRKELAGLIVESSFVSAFRVATRIRILPFDKFNSIDKIKKINCPVLIIHGKADKLINFRHGQKLYEAANNPKMKFWVDGAGHNDVFFRAGDAYLDAITEFTGKILTKDTIE